jgi:lipoyl(octanoyl) transferase|tara:strand:+ start:2153 stop:2782 length:630 start_codon:yes stop_codon:yes gene_type:complete
MSQLTFQDLGKDRDFQEIWDLQEDLVKQRREGKIDDTILLLEHSPVYTIGRTRDQSSLRDTPHLPHPVVEINRGGQGTYHGPGQLVGYPILDLSEREKDLHVHLRNLEEALIRGLAKFGISAQRRESLTGVWVENRKIASLGVGVRSWVTLHGFALNVQAITMPPFQFITPCGIDGVSMTCAEDETQKTITVSRMKSVMETTLREVFES